MSRIRTVERPYGRPNFSRGARQAALPLSPCATLHSLCRSTRAHSLAQPCGTSLASKLSLSLSLSLFQLLFSFPTDRSIEPCSPDQRHRYPSPEPPLTRRPPPSFSLRDGVSYVLYVHPARLVSCSWSLSWCSPLRNLSLVCFSCLYRIRATLLQPVEKAGQGELVAQVAGADERGWRRPSAGVRGDGVPNRAG